MPIRLIDELKDEIIQDKSISKKNIKIFNKKYGKRFWQALKAVNEKRVIHYFFEPSNRDEWIVIGNKRDYLIKGDVSCECEDFFIRVVNKQEIELCYHLIARIIAEIFKLEKIIRINDEKYEDYLEEWRKL